MVPVSFYSTSDGFINDVLLVSLGNLISAPIREEAFNLGLSTENGLRVGYGALGR